MGNQAVIGSWYLGADDAALGTRQRLRSPAHVVSATLAKHPCAVGKSKLDVWCCDSEEQHQETWQCTKAKANPGSGICIGGRPRPTQKQQRAQNDCIHDGSRHSLP